MFSPVNDFRTSMLSDDREKLTYICREQIWSSLLSMDKKSLKILTVKERQPWTNYENNGNEHLIIEAVVRSE